MFPIYIYIALLILVALLATRVMRFFKLPNVTGYIITGILVGPFVFGLFFNHFSFDGIKDVIIYEYVSKISFVSTIALGFIAFSIGTSFKLSTIKRVGKRVLVITALEAMAASLFVILIMVVLHFIISDIMTWELVLTLGAIASATAPAATLMVIKQYQAKGEIVDTLLPVVALDDAAALILFSILFQIGISLNSNGDFSIYRMLFKPIIEILLSLGLGAIIGFILSLANRFFLSRNNRLVWAIFSVFLALGLYMLFKNEKMGGFELSSLLMCMASGAIYINFGHDNGKTLDLLERFTYPIYMMFFVISGASLDLTIFASKDGWIILVIALVYIVFRVVGKYSGAYVGAKATHCSNEVTKYLGLTLIPQAGVAIGLATNANLLFSQNPNTIASGALIVAIILTSTLVYELIGPMISKYALKKAHAIEGEE